MQIDNTHINEAERLLIGDNHFDEERLSFIINMKSCDLLAVPGSGKTTALQAKLYCLSKVRPLSSNNGILVLAHTNAAVDEIKRNLLRVCPSLFEYPNFVGTIQDFVDRFLAIPFYNKKFGHSITRIDSEIYQNEFVKLFSHSYRKGDTVWNYYINKGEKQALEFGIKTNDGDTLIPWNYSSQKVFIAIATKVPKTWNGKVEQNRSHIYDELYKLKCALFRRGILNYYDCYFFAQVYLLKNPKIVNILRKRFSYVFIDETQDLQEHQIEIIDHIFNNEDVCLQRIGDINQSIFHTGIESTDCVWKPRDIMTFNNSLRLTDSVASIVDSFMFQRESGLTLNGRRVNGQDIKPHLFVYDYDHRELLKTEFEHLIEQYNLRNVPEKKYGFHIIAWSAQWKDTKMHIPSDLRLSDIFPEDIINKVDTPIKQNSLAGYIIQSQNFSNNKQRCHCIDAIICECLRLCNKFDVEIIKGSSYNRLYTHSSFRNYITEKHNDLLPQYKLRVLSITKKMAMSEYVEAFSNCCELIKWLMNNLGVATNEDYNSFMSVPFEHIETPAQEHEELQIETIHRAKGQTHCATLYVETMYKGCYESAHVLNKVKHAARKKSPAVYCSNPFYKEKGVQHKNSYAQSSIKMAYVGLSRPTHLLCYAMHKSSFDRYDADKLRECGWQIIDLTI